MSKQVNIREEQVYGHLVIVEELKPYISPTGRRQRRVRVQCLLCGNTMDIRLDRIRSNGRYKACRACLGKGTVKSSRRGVQPQSSHVRPDFEMPEHGVSLDELEELKPFFKKPAAPFPKRKYTSPVKTLKTIPEPSWGFPTPIEDTGLFDGTALEEIPPKVIPDIHLSFTAVFKTMSVDDLNTLMELAATEIVSRN